MLKKVLKGLGIAFASIIGLFLLLAVALYIPPVQNFVVRRVTDYASSHTGMTVRVDRVRLAFPLDLTLMGAFARQNNDTVLDSRCVRVNVALLPLLKSRIDVDGLEIYDSKLNTIDLISDTQIKGRVGRLIIRSHGIDLGRSTAEVERLNLSKSDISVLLSDTARKDTTPSKPTLWKINTGELSISDSRVRVRLPGDSMRIAAAIDRLRVNDGRFDLFRGLYTVQNIRLNASSISYDIPYLSYEKGLDINHLSFSGLTAFIDSLHYESGTVRAAVRRLAFAEKSGLRLDNLKGGLYVDSARVELSGFRLTTPYSTLSATGVFPFDALKKEGKNAIRMRVKGNVDRRDIISAVPGGLPSSVTQFLPARPIGLKATLSGSRGRLRVEGGRVDVPGVATLRADGVLSNLTTAPSGDIRYSLLTRDISYIKKAVGIGRGSGIDLPAGMSASGRLTFTPTRYATNSVIRMGGGSARVNGYYDTRSESYSARINTRALPLGRIVEGSGLHSLTADIMAAGRGFDPFARGTSIRAKAALQRFGVSSYDLSGINLSARLSGGAGTVNFRSANSLLAGSGTINAHFTRSSVRGDIRTLLDSLDLQKLMQGDKRAKLATRTKATFYANSSMTSYGIDATVDSILFLLDSGKTAHAKDLLLRLDNHRDSLYARISAGDLFLLAHSPRNIDHISKGFTRFATLLTRQLKRRRLDQEALRRTLPEVSLLVEAGTDNPLSNFLKYREGYTFSRLHLNLDANNRAGISGDGYVYSFDTGSLLLDTTTLSLYHDTTGLRLRANVRNTTKRNPYIFNASLTARLLNDGVDAGLIYRDKKNKEGMNVGVQAMLTDTGTTFRLYPERPVIAYRKFKINKDNYFTILDDKTILSDIDLLADDGTGLKVYSDRTDSLSDITVSVNRLNLGELTSSIPYAPDIAGLLSGDFHIVRQESQITAAYDLNVQDMNYAGAPLGNIGAVGTYMPMASENSHFVNVSLTSEGNEVASLDGVYHGQTDSVKATLQLLHFPTAMLNGFTGETLSLGGALDGNLELTGTTSHPLLNGKMLLDSVRLYSEVYGFDMLVGNDSAVINNSVLNIDTLNLYSAGNNPLVVDGVINFADLSNVNMDMKVNGNNFRLINSRETAKSELYGTVYADVDASVRGTLSQLFVYGQLDVLPESNVSYVLRDSPLSAENDLNTLVNFTDFSDTATVEQQPEASTGVTMIMRVNISDAAHLHCDINADKQSYLDVEGGGNLTFKYMPDGEMSLTGRYTIGSGEMKYAMPVIPLRTFYLKDGSYIEFTGEPMNPTLNLSATERVKASVSDGDKPRSVNFDVGLKLTKPLSQMGLEFTIEAPEDQSVQNQLASMSAEQKNKLAISMLATGLYLEQSNTAGSIKTSNALNAFLQNQVQQIAGKALKSVDLSLSVDNSTSSTGEDNTDYSFRFSKRFWGDRVNIIIGGHVSTGEDARNDASSFIDNVSLEYRLDKSAGRYIRLFYDHDSQDPLEGKLIEAGAGLVLRRKVENFGEIFTLWKNSDRKKKTTKSASGSPAAATKESDNNVSNEKSQQ